MVVQSYRSLRKPDELKWKWNTGVVFVLRRYWPVDYWTFAGSVIKPREETVSMWTHIRRSVCTQTNTAELNMRFMFLGGPGEHQDVPDEHTIHEVLEDVVNQSLENNRNITRYLNWSRWRPSTLPQYPSLILTMICITKDHLAEHSGAFNNLRTKKAAGIYFCVTHGSQCMVSSFVCFLYKEESKRRGRGQTMPAASE